MKTRHPLKEIPFEDNANIQQLEQPQQAQKASNFAGNRLQINTSIPPIPPKRKPSEHSLKYISSSASLKSNSVENTQIETLSQKLNADSGSNSVISTPTTNSIPNLSWLDKNRLDPSADIIHSLEFYQSFDSPTFTAKFPLNANPILEFPKNSNKDPLTFCVDKNSTNRVNPSRMLPKIRQQNWLELELDIVLTLRLDPQTLVKSSIIHKNSDFDGDSSGMEDSTDEEDDDLNEGNNCSIHGGFHWFLLHTDSDQNIEEILEKWAVSLSENKSFTLSNLYPIHPTPIENKPNLFKWSWNWSHLTNPSCLFVGHKNLCTLVKVPINAPHKVLPVVGFTFWTEAAPTRPRRRTLLDISSPRGKSASTPHILSESEYSESSNLKLINNSESKSSELKITSENDQSVVNESSQKVTNDAEESKNEYTAQLNALPGITPNPSPPSINSLSQMPSSLEFVEDEDLIIENYSTEDGPVFRATISQLERKIFSFKHDIKRMIKLGQEVMETRKAAMLAESEFHNALCSLPAIQPLKATYLQEASESITSYETHWMENFQSLILDPLSNLYDQDIKLAESKKKNFDQTSDDFYNFLNKYLGAKNKNNKQNLSEAKYNSRRRIFELSRFDYFNYLSELRGGGKDQDLLNLFTIYSETQYSHFSNIHRSLFRLHDNLLELDKKITQSNHILMLQRKDRKKQRKDIDASIPDIKDSESNTNKLSNIPNIISGNSGSADSEKSDPNQKFKGIRDLQMSNRETTLAIGRKREGFLFTPSKTSSASNVLDKNLGINASFHKKWCVLSGGYLHEYNNWKRQLESNTEPISLQFSTVRVASQLSRRFCFEIVTPKFKKIYQAMSEEDMLTWISCISNSIESLWNGTGSSDNIKLKEKSPPSKFKSGTPTIATQNSLGEADFLDKADNPELITLIERLRQIDPSNNICADCDSSNPDWCSINFGILLCIECSGLHRSLGTHITKIRSLILDVITFTPDLVSVIEGMGNRRANIIWEAAMDENKGYVEPTGEKWVKPIISDDRGLKLKFVKAKYIDHKFVDRSLPPISDLTPYTNLVDVPSANYHATLSLYDACYKCDLTSALKYIVLGGVVNSFCNIDPDHEAYSLSNSGPISPLQLALFSKKKSSTEENIKPEERLFTLPELLIQNGANVNQLNPINQNTVLHHAARANDSFMIKYLLSKGADPALPLNNHSQWPSCLTTDPMCSSILSEVTMGSGNPSPPKTNLVQFRASPIVNGKSYISMPPSSSNIDMTNGVSGLGVLLEGNAASNDKHLRFNAPRTPSSPHSRSYSLQPQLLSAGRQNRHSDPTDLESPKYFITETGGVSQSSSSKSSPSDLKNPTNLKHNLKGFKNQLNSFTQSHHAINKTKEDEPPYGKPGRSSISHDRSSSSKIPIKPTTKFTRSKTQSNVHHHLNTSSELDENSQLSTNADMNTSSELSSQMDQINLSHSLPASSLLTQLDEKLDQVSNNFKRPVLKLPTSILGKIKKISNNNSDVKNKSSSKREGFL